MSTGSRCFFGASLLSPVPEKVPPHCVRALFPPRALASRPRVLMPDLLFALSGKSALQPVSTLRRFASLGKRFPPGAACLAQLAVPGAVRASLLLRLLEHFVSPFLLSCYDGIVFCPVCQRHIKAYHVSRTLFHPCRLFSPEPREPFSTACVKSVSASERGIFMNHIDLTALDDRLCGSIS